MFVELHSIDIKLIERLLKIIQILKLERHRYSIQIDGNISIWLKLYNPTIEEHHILIAHGGQATTKSHNSLFQTNSIAQLYQFTYPGIKED